MTPPPPSLSLRYRSFGASLIPRPKRNKPAPSEDEAALRREVGFLTSQLSVQTARGERLQAEVRILRERADQPDPGLMARLNMLKEENHDLRRIRARHETLVEAIRAALERTG